MICRKETITYKAKPQIYDINKYKLIIFPSKLSSLQTLDFILVGNFLNILNVYLSASDSLIFDIPSTFLMYIENCRLLGFVISIIVSSFIYDMAILVIRWRFLSEEIKTLLLHQTNPP